MSPSATLSSHTLMSSTTCNSCTSTFLKVMHSWPSDGSYWYLAFLQRWLCTFFFFYFFSQTKMSWRSLLTLQNLLVSRFRAVQCYDDPTVAVVADLTRSEVALHLLYVVR